MAYISDNLYLATQALGGGLPKVYIYKNATPDADATIAAAGYVSDGVAKGMKVGDLVDAIDTGTAKYKRYQVTTISGTTVTVAAPTAIT